MPEEEDGANMDVDGPANAMVRHCSRSLTPANPGFFISDDRHDHSS